MTLKHFLHLFHINYVMRIAGLQNLKVPKVEIIYVFTTFAFTHFNDN